MQVYTIRELGMKYVTENMANEEQMDISSRLFNEASVHQLKNV